MAQFEPLQAEIEELRASVLFIAAEKRAGMFKPEGFFTKHPVSFPFLLDEDRSVTKAYGVHNRLALDAIDIAKSNVRGDVRGDAKDPNLVTFE